MLTSAFLWLYLPWGLFIILMVIYIVDSLKTKNTDVHLQKDAKNIKRLEERDKAFKATKELNSIILDTLDFKIVIQKIANSIPQLLGYPTGVLALVDEEEGTLKRVAISETTGGHAAMQFLEVPFSSISIKLTEKDNFCIKALNENRVLYTTKLFDVLRPVISKENSDKVQSQMGTQTTLIYPIFSKDKKPYGTFLVSMNKSYDQISEYEHETISNYVDGIRIALNNSTLYSSLSKTTEQLQSANIQLQQLDKLKDEFVSVASHELRTPMTAIKSYLWMALDGKGGQLNEKQRYYIQRGYNSVDRLIRLVNDMLNISRIESGRIVIELKPVNLVKLAQEVVEEVTPRAEEVGVSISLIKPEADIYVMADTDKIKEVMFNLIGNSIKFTPKDGTISLEFSKKDGFVQTAISDTGSGIEPDDMNKLFQKFGLLSGSYTTNQSAMGTGLGLYICKSIVNLHKGTIWATSEGRGKGSTFTFTLKEATKEDMEKEQKQDETQKEAVGLIHTQF